MAFTVKKGWVDYVVFGLSVFLIFCLVFESYVKLPVPLAWLGRWHPVVLHFPIVLLLIAAFLGLTGKKIPRTLLAVAVFAALITAISGFFLGKESETKGDLLFWHQLMGGAVALLSALWYGLDGLNLEKKAYVKILQVALIGLVFLTGHYGGMVTHGEDFLALPFDKSTEKIPENPLVYQHVVNRILQQNCVSCHNPNKQKGQLLMTNLNNLLAGGKVGNTVVPGDIEKSELIRRLHLPSEDEEHMPPDGKKPLSHNEIAILERWIALGASDTLRLGHLGKEEPLVGLITGLMEPNSLEKWVNLPTVADSTLQNLSSDYLTINRVSNRTDALSIAAFLPPEYDPHTILKLERVAGNIIELDLSGLPIGGKEMGLVGKCTKLEWLELDRTPVSDAEIDTLRNLSKLRLLKIYDTNIGDRSIAVFRSLENLQRLYLWKTKASPKAIADLESHRPDLLLDDGIDEELEAYFTANDTILP